MSEAPPQQPHELAIGSSGTGGAALTPLALRYLDQTRPWVRFMAIMTFVGAGLSALVAVAMLAVGLAGGLSGRDGSAPGGLGGALGSAMLALVYLATACLYVAPGVFLFRYAQAIRLLQATGATAALEDALKHQKSFWRFAGIVTAVGLVIAAILIGLAIAVGVLGAMMASRT